MYDLLVVCYLLNQKIFKIQKKYIKVTSKGQTKILKKQKNNCNLVTDANPKKIKKLFFDTINY